MNENRNQKISKNRKEKQGEALLDMIRANRILMEHIEQEYEFNQARIGVLQNIFLNMGHLEKEAIKSDIYLYGSLIKRNDLVARQMFLWLLGMAENMSA